MATRFAKGRPGLTGTNLEYTRGFNRRIVFETIRVGGASSRSEIAERTSLTFQTVTNIVQELMEEGLVVSGAKRQGRRGSPSTEIRVNPEGAFAIGLNLDRDRLTGALVDLGGTVHARVHHDVSASDHTLVLHLLLETARTLLAHELGDRVWGIGVGVPGPLHLDDDAEGLPTDLQAWRGIRLSDWLQSRLELPVLLERNSDAAAIGEAWYGVATVSSFYYVFVGVGIGGSAIVNGRVQRGSARLAGKIGDIPVFDRGPAPSTVKDHFSLASLHAHLARHGHTSWDPAALEALHARGDTALLHWLDAAADVLTPPLLTIEYLLDGDAIVFGGRLPRPLLRHVLRGVELRLTHLRAPQKVRHPVLREASVGDDAAALGVATLPLYEMLAPDHHLLLKNVTASKASRRERSTSIGR